MTINRTRNQQSVFGQDLSGHQMVGLVLKLHLLQLLFHLVLVLAEEEDLILVQMGQILV